MKFSSEAELCQHMISHFAVDGVRAFPEAGGGYGKGAWDILFVHPDGRQYGIQAKLRPSFQLLSSVLDSTRGYISGRAIRKWPDHIGILIGSEPSRDFHIVAIQCELRIFNPPFKYDDPGYIWTNADYTETTARVEIPDFIPDLPAGASSPLQMTPWKIKAIKLGARLDEKGFLTTDDFDELHLSKTIWFVDRFDSKGNKFASWLIRERRGKYIRNPGVILPHDKHSSKDKDAIMVLLNHPRS